MRVASTVELTDEQRQTLEQWARGRSLPARQVERARIVLLAANGELDVAIAAKLSITNQKAARWRARFLALGLAGLEKDAPRPGRTPSISSSTVKAVIQKTTQERPANARHWSTRTMAAEVGISEASVRRIWKAHGLKPHLVESFKVGNDPEFSEKLEAIVCISTRPNTHWCCAATRRARSRLWTGRNRGYR
jgi:transposase